MKQSLSFISMALLILSTGQILAQKKTAPEPKPSMGIVKPLANEPYDLSMDYYPLTLGSSWNYSVSIGDTKDPKSIEFAETNLLTVTQVSPQSDGSMIVNVDTKRDKHGTISESLKIAGTNILRNIPSDPPEKSSGFQIVNLKMKPGLSWKWSGIDCVLGENTEPFSQNFTASGFEKVTTQAGTFDCIHVSMTFAGDVKSPQEYWYALGVGIVKAKTVFKLRDDSLVFIKTLISYDIKKTINSDEQSSRVTKDSLTKLPATEYFPITVGSKWVYIDNPKGKNKTEFTVSDVKLAKDGKSAIVSFQKLAPGFGLLNLPFAVDETGVENKVALADDPLSFFDMRVARQILKLPLTKGAKWEENCDSELRGVKMKQRSSFEVGAVETVIVPAGKFQALKIIESLTITNTAKNTKDKPFTVHIETWYAPKVGMLRRKILDGPSSDQVLQSYIIK